MLATIPSIQHTSYWQLKSRRKVVGFRGMPFITESAELSKLLRLTINVTGATQQ